MLLQLFVLCVLTHVCIFQFAAFPIVSLIIQHTRHKKSSNKHNIMYNNII